MKVKISEEGLLYMERAGQMKPQYCPYSQDPARNGSMCGDWCPLFGAPENNPVITRDAPTMWIRRMTSLELCRKIITVDKADFIDERTTKGESK
jgi:hypothetical protein